MQVKSWYPLFAPQILFKDRQNEINAFLETNPAVFVDGEVFTILVRLVNYRKFSNRAYKMGGMLSESNYHLFKAKYGPCGFEITYSAPVTFINNLPTYYSCWTGFEDIRFLDKDRILCTSPTSSPEGNPVIVQGILKDNTITIQSVCEPSKIEKNWMPFQVGTQDYVLYSAYPLSLKKLSSPIPQVLHYADELKGFHGSTNGIVWGEGFLFIIHKYEYRTMHKWLYFEPVCKKYGYSESFVFHPHSYIEFTCSLVAHNEKLFVGLGVNDDKAFLCEVSHPELPTFTYHDFCN
jgi:hypothetical protein